MLVNLLLVADGCLDSFFAYFLRFVAFLWREVLAPVLPRCYPQILTQTTNDELQTFVPSLFISLEFPPLFVFKSGF